MKCSVLKGLATAFALAAVCSFASCSNPYETGDESEDNYSYVDDTSSSSSGKSDESADSNIVTPEDTYAIE